MDDPSRHAKERVSLDSLKGERHIEIYELESRVVKTYQVGELQKQNSPPSLTRVPVQKWTMRADIILPFDHEAKKGPVRIASVPIPFSMAVQRSIFGQEKSIYVAPRV
ncbi:hypothetical protein F5Y10DRAFT_265783 [Nemania abortiva]|nr:hypothetical protein F5Y10DRAFT_265783 [Nemania abortiva]